MFQISRPLLLTSLLALATLLGPGAGPAAAHPMAAPLALYSCHVQPRQVVSPKVLLLGETATVTLDTPTDCTYVPDPRHVVLLLESSAVLSRDSLQQVREAASLLIRTLLDPGEPPAKIAIVALSQGAQVRCRLTEDPAKLDVCLQRLRPQGEAAVDLGLRQGYSLLTRERAALPARVSPDEVLILISNGVSKDGWRLVPSEARRIKQAGILLITLYLECDGHWGCLWGLASSQRYAFALEDVAEAARIFVSGPYCPVGPRLERFTLEVILPPEVAYVAGSAIPPAALSPDGRTLAWSLAEPFRPRDAISYRIRPLASGTLPSSLRSSATFNDPTTGRPSRADFPQQLLTVLEPAHRP